MKNLIPIIMTLLVAAWPLVPRHSVVPLRYMMPPVVKKRTPGVSAVQLSVTATDSGLLAATYCLHPFSHNAQPDSFFLGIYATSYFDTGGTARFHIYGRDRQLIYGDTFKLQEMLGDHVDEPVEKQPEIIQKAISDFFDSVNFTFPAIGKDEAYHPDVSKWKTWIAIRENRAAVGFTYAYGYEGVYSIAYDTGRKQTVVYWKYDTVGQHRDAPRLKLP